MLQAKIIILAFVDYLAGLFASSILTGINYFGPAYVSTVQSMISFKVVESNQSFGVFKFLTPVLAWWSAMWNMITLNLPIFGTNDSPWQIVRWVFAAPITAVIIFGIAMALWSLLSYALS